MARERRCPPPALPAELHDAVAGYRWARNLVGEAGAAVYRLHGRADAPDLYLKHGVGNIAGDVADEAARIDWLAGRLPTATLRHLVRGHEDAWMLTTALRGQTAYQLLQSDAAAADAVVDVLADFLRQMHAIPIAACPFDSGHRQRLDHARARIAAGQVATDDFDEARRGWSANQVWDALQSLLPLPIERVVTHGDFSLDNILFDGGAISGCIDLGRLGLADRYQDLAILWNCLGEFGPALQQRLFDRYGIDDPDPRRLEFHLLLDELF